MPLFDFLKRDKGYDLEELARRLGVAADELRSIQPSYHKWTIPKRNGRGERRIASPDPQLKAIQRRILRRLLALMVSHPAATGFERGRSIVTNARLHAGQAVVIKMDLKDFFNATAAERVHRFFRRAGWNREAYSLLGRLCTHEGGLPQGAPTSPRLANLVNYLLDTRLDRLAAAMGARYSRYADDITFSMGHDRRGAPRRLVHAAGEIIREHGYRVNRPKTRVLRAHQQQRVTGLVVNREVNLPRAQRRRLRAIKHHLANGREATLGPPELAGWHALEHMVQVQREAP